MSEIKDRTLTVSKHEIVVDRHQTVNIVVEGGMVVEVDGLPVDWQYYIDDRDCPLENEDE